MHLHENRLLFTNAVLAAAEHLDIQSVYIEKDYWITRSLWLLAQNSYAHKAVFKGGTSLSKAHKIGYRFSEDIDVAISNADTMSGNQLKMLIKRLAKEMTSGLSELVIPGTTNKGSRYYKAVYAYPTILDEAVEDTVRIGQLLVEVNSFANPYPYEQKTITSFIGDLLQQAGNESIIKDYNLGPFSLNVLDKKQTLTEKIISLIRFSLSDNYEHEMTVKIRHFYDLYYLLQNKDCVEYLHSPQFKKDFDALLSHDKEIFDNPIGWKQNH